MIEVEQLSKTYGAPENAPALDEVSFRIERGEVVGLLGPNGAGKTTAMRILTGLMAPTSGTARIDNLDIARDAREVRRRIGYLPENAPLYLDMTVRDYLMYLAALRGVSAKDRPQRLEAALDAGKLEEHADTLILKLSKGFRQRVGLAQAIVHNPDVVILDEPSAGLDPRQRVETRRFMRSLSREHTVILSTHILPDVQTTCSRVLIIHRGKLVAQDTTQNLGAQANPNHVAPDAPLVLRLALSHAPHDVLGKLQAFSGVQSVEKEATESSSASTWILHATRDVREELARHCVRHDWGLLELNRVRRSLEDVFLSLTTGD